MTRDEQRGELHGPWPTTVEQVQADHPEWEIWRELTGDRHGVWHARHEPLVGAAIEVDAATPEQLGERIARART